MKSQTIRGEAGYHRCKDWEEVKGKVIRDYVKKAERVELQRDRMCERPERVFLRKGKVLTARMIRR